MCEQYFDPKGDLKCSVNNGPYISVLNSELMIWTGILSFQVLHKWRSAMLEARGAIALDSP